MDTRSKSQIKNDQSSTDGGCDTTTNVGVQHDVDTMTEETIDHSKHNDALMAIVEERDKEIIELKSMMSDMALCKEEKMVEYNEPMDDRRLAGDVGCAGKRGDPIKFLPQFTWDSKDLNETKRFVSAFRNLSKENKWTETHARAAFESKLAGRGRTKYYEGLGDVEGIPFESRLKEFEQLFSRELKPSQGQDLFWTCKQHAGETVISYKLRLVSLGNAYKKGFKDPSLFGQLLFQQFIKGLREKLRLEVVKAKLNTFEEAVGLATELEEVEMTYSDHGVVINSVQTESIIQQDEVLKLQQELGRVKSMLESLQQSPIDVPSEADRNHIAMSGGGHSGSSVCMLCKKVGHGDATCYMRMHDSKGNRKLNPNAPSV